MRGLLTRHQWMAIAGVAACAAVFSMAGCSQDAGSVATSKDSPPTGAAGPDPGPLFTDATGQLAAVSFNEPISASNAFFKPFGSNGRSCATCHQSDQAFSITPPAIQALFDKTDGNEPLFASVDGANCPGAPRADRAAHSLVLEHGLIRVPQVMPDDAEFSISAVHDPYGCALLTDASGRLVVSVYRRPLPTANVAFLSTVMWDGRETVSTLDVGQSFDANLQANLTHQVLSAVTAHGETSTAPSSAAIAEMVRFELGLFTAQLSDRRAGPLDAQGGRGGAVNLGGQQYFPGINDSLGREPNGAAFNPLAMRLFGEWLGKPSDAAIDPAAAAQHDIAAGEVLFNTAPLRITAVRGLNDDATLSNPPVIPGTCTTCHDTPNVGNHSFTLGLDIGVAHAQLAGLESDVALAAAIDELQPVDLPIFEIHGCPSALPGGEPVSQFTTDPGKALITGRCRDVSRFKGPVLRALAGRAPYFHNGTGGTLEQVVSFYNQRFQMSLTANQMRQLVAFLNSL